MPKWDVDLESRPLLPTRDDHAAYSYMLALVIDRLAWVVGVNGLIEPVNVKGSRIH